MTPDPEQDGWMLPLDFLDRVRREIQTRRPALIVECGSGRSTRAWADAAAGYGGRVVSLEHDPRFHLRTLGMLDGREVQVWLAPIRDGWYARYAWTGLRDIGLLIVDGPPGNLNPGSRLPAMANLHDRLVPGALIVLDDTNRDAERRAVDAWLADYPDLRLVETVEHSIGQATLLERTAA